MGFSEEPDRGGKWALRSAHRVTGDPPRRLDPGIWLRKWISGANLPFVDSIKWHLWTPVVNRPALG